MKFTKMHGAGNDYVYVDCFETPFPDDPHAIARAMSDRHTGIGGDGVIFICPSNRADAWMRMFNVDGSESEMCGNGLRCVAKYVYEKDICRQPRFQVETGAGVLDVELTRDTNDLVVQVRVDMGPPILAADEIPTQLSGNSDLPGNPVVNQTMSVGDRCFEVTCVSMGNPHCVIFVPEANDDLVLTCGPLIENDSRFPARVNVEFVEWISSREVRQRTWERGSGETLACGTGASAVCVAGVLTGRTERKIVNHLRGGDLELEWDVESDHVFMAGPAVEVFTGFWHGAGRLDHSSV